MRSKAPPSQALRALYTIAELAQMSGVSRFAMARLLKARNVPVVRSGRTCYVTLPSLEVYFSDVWDAIKESSAYNSALA